MKIISHGHGAEASSKPDRQIATIKEQLANFELGHFLLENQGLNGFWTSYILLYPAHGRLTNLSSDGTPMCDLEKWILNSCPIILATQERFQIFRQITQEKLQSRMRLASIPCGLMDDLISLDYSKIAEAQITGVDLDESSIAHAKLKLASLNPNVTASFECRDAWNLESQERWDLITSNGLNIYVEKAQDCIELYRSFAKSLRTGGSLVISFISDPSTWTPYSSQDLSTQKLVFSGALNAKWQFTRSEQEVSMQLASAGFEVQAIKYDNQKMFPSVLARKL